MGRYYRRHPVPPVGRLLMGARLFRPVRPVDGAVDATRDPAPRWTLGALHICPGVARPRAARSILAADLPARADLLDRPPRACRLRLPLSTLSLASRPPRRPRSLAASPLRRDLERARRGGGSRSRRGRLPRPARRGAASCPGRGGHLTR